MNLLTNSSPIKVDRFKVMVRQRLLSLILSLLVNPGSIAPPPAIIRFGTVTFLRSDGSFNRHSRINFAKLRLSSPQYPFQTRDKICPLDPSIISFTSISDPHLTSSRAKLYPATTSTPLADSTQSPLFINGSIKQHLEQRSS
ncbi:expressed protein [Phakopsora pachyrhizi]|uniref:Expressed protein n=1 Tax=Phakopsora pachyrhizi TaxID=170000 RepID=A0AAV0AX78_PHAPC|nr:expressed protein [Phakopsora pachyrhizi]